MKKIISTIILSSAFSLGLSLSVNAETLHAYIFAASMDPQIGKTVNNDAKYIKSNLEKISKSIGYTSDIKLLTEESFVKSQIDNVLNNELKNVGINDIVVFYISSHGTNMAGRFPHIVENNSALISSETYIHEKVKNSKARLKLTIIDACNNVSGIDISNESKSKNIELFRKNYKKLFVTSKGDLLISSSEKGKYSIAGPVYSIFTQQFILALSTVAGSKDDNKISWKNVLEKASDFTFHESTIFHDAYGEQVQPYRPVWSNNIQENKSSPIADMTFSLNSSAKRLSLAERKKLSTNETHQVNFNLNTKPETMANITKVIYYYAEPLDITADGKNENNTKTLTVTSASTSFGAAFISSVPYLVWADIYMKNNDIQVMEPQTLNLEND